MLVRHNKFQIKAKVSLKPDGKYHLVSEKDLDKLAGNPNPKKHAKAAIMYFTTSMGFLYIILSLPEYTILKNIPLTICFGVTMILGLFRKYQYIKSLKNIKKYYKKFRN